MAASNDIKCDGVVVHPSLRKISCSVSDIPKITSCLRSSTTAAAFAACLDSEGCQKHDEMKHDPEFLSELCRNLSLNSELRRRGVFDSINSFFGGGKSTKDEATPTQAKSTKKPAPTTTKDDNDNSTTVSPTRASPRTTSATPTSTEASSSASVESTSTPEPTTQSSTSETSTTSSRTTTASSTLSTSTTPTPTTALPAATTTAAAAPAPATGASTGIKVAIGVVGALAGLCLLLLCFFWIRRQRRNRVKAAALEAAQRAATHDEKKAWDDSGSSTTTEAAPFKDMRNAELRRQREVGGDAIPLTSTAGWRDDQERLLPAVPAAGLQRNASFQTGSEEQLNRPDAAAQPSGLSSAYVPYRPFASKYQPSPVPTSQPKAFVAELEGVSPVSPAKVVNGGIPVEIGGTGRAQVMRKPLAPSQ